MPPHHGTSYSASHLPTNVNGGNNLNRMDQERMKKIEAVERKQKELQDTHLAEERLLSNAMHQKVSNFNGSQTPTPPPLPESSPPEHAANDGSNSQNQVQSGSARLDMLVGTIMTNGGSPHKDGSNFKPEGKEIPTKRVSFLTSSNGNEGMPGDYDTSANLNDEKWHRLERAEEKGPNVSKE